jgi:hypothetical protein
LIFSHVPGPGFHRSRAAAKKSLAHSAGIEMRRKLLGRNVAKRLSVDSQQSSPIQFAVIGDRECLPDPAGSQPSQLDVAATLGRNSEAERRENFYNVRA